MYDFLFHQSLLLDSVDFFCCSCLLLPGHLLNCTAHKIPVALCFACKFFHPSSCIMLMSLGLFPCLLLTYRAVSSSLYFFDCYFGLLLIWVAFCRSIFHCWSYVYLITLSFQESSDYVEVSVLSTKVSLGLPFHIVYVFF